MAWVDLSADVTAEFALVPAAPMSRPRLLALEGFDIDDPAALAAECARLERRRLARMEEDRRALKARSPRRRKKPLPRTYEDPQRPCAICTNTVPVGKFSYSVKLYCGAECRRASRRVAYKKTPDLSPIPCEWCGATFTPQKHGRFCQKKCRNAANWNRRRIEMKDPYQTREKAA